MTTQVKLAWLGPTIYGIESEIDTLDLYGGSDGFTIPEDGWKRAVGERGASNVRETLSLLVVAESDDDLALQLQTLDLWQKRVEWSAKPIESREVWLRLQMEDETGAYQAMLSSFSYQPAEDFLTERAPYHIEFTLTLERAPREDVAWSALATLSGLNSLGGLADLGVSIDGDLPARLPVAALETYDNLRKVWVGFRSADRGNPANFQPVWPLHAANSGGLSLDTTVVSDADAYDGTCLDVSFSYTEEMSPRVIMQVQDLSVMLGHDISSDQAGHFGILLRAKLTAGSSECHVRIGYGWAARSPYVINNPTWRPPQRVLSTDYNLLEMKSVVFPPDKIVTQLTNAGIVIEARRISGTAHLCLDILGLVPLDEGMLQAETNQALGETPLDGLWIAQAPQGKVSGVVALGGHGLPLREIVDAAAIEPQGWSLPASDASPSVVVFAQRSGSSVKTDTLDFSYVYARRWRLMRGGE